MLIDKYLKHFDVSELHKIEFRGKPETVYPLMLQAHLSRSFWIRTLFRLRGMTSDLNVLTDLEKVGFVKLDEIKNTEIIFGIVTTSSSFSNCNSNLTPAAFPEINSTGVIKAVISFKTISAANNTTVVSTETRIACFGNTTKRKFRIYWFFISPFSKLIRKLMLQQIKAEVAKSLKEV